MLLGPHNLCSATCKTAMTALFHAALATAAASLGAEGLPHAGDGQLQTECICSIDFDSAWQTVGPYVTAAFSHHTRRRLQYAPPPPPSYLTDAQAATLPAVQIEAAASPIVAVAAGMDFLLLLRPGGICPRWIKGKTESCFWKACWCHWRPHSDCVPARDRGTSWVEFTRTAPLSRPLKD